MASSTIAENRRARFEYSFSEFFEAGIVLTGAEIKSIRAKRADMSSTYARIAEGEAWLINLNLSGVRVEHPTRTRKLLLHKHEIDRLMGLADQKGLALIPIKLYFHRGKAKIELGVGKGRKLHDKREVLKARDAEREKQRGLRD